MAKWLTSDWHFGDDRWDLLQRPFKNTTESFQVVRDNHNKLVSKDDTVYFLGDALYQKADPKKWIPKIDELNGKKILVKGNHDVFDNDDYKKVFQEIIEEGKGVDLTIDGLDCYLTHYPSQGKLKKFNLVGHIHGNWRVQLNMLNVGIDAHHLYPVPFEKVAFYYEAVCKYYDKDAFIAYDPLNKSYFNNRGKKTSYFNP